MTESINENIYLLQQKLIVIEIYTLSNNKSIAVTENFFTNLHIIITEIQGNKKMLLLEDSNWKEE